MPTKLLKKPASMVPLGLSGAVKVVVKPEATIRPPP